MKRILLVDDHDGIRMLLCDVLREIGYSMTEARSFCEARGLLLGQRFDLLLAEAALAEGGSGAELAFAAEGRGIKALLMTGNARHMRELRSQGREFVTKPFRLATLMRSIGGMWQE